MSSLKSSLERLEKRIFAGREYPTVRLVLYDPATEPAALVAAREREIGGGFVLLPDNQRGTGPLEGNLVYDDEE